MTSKKDKEQPNKSFHFEGFSSPQYTQVPDQLFDELLAKVTGAELKVLLYICRRTFGFKKEDDNISINQMLHGIQKKDGTRLDHGVGLSKPTLLRALKALRAKQIIVTRRRQDSAEGDLATNYQLHLKGTRGQKMKHGEEEIFTTPRGTDFNHQQQTVEQQTDAAQRKALLSFGIDRPTVDRLVKRHDSTLIDQKIDYVTYLQEEQPDRVSNPRGWLLKAIEDDYEPPAGYRPRAEREAEARDRDRRAKAATRRDAKLQEAAEEAARLRQREEQQAMTVLQERYGTTQTETDLWHDMLAELQRAGSATTYAFAKAIHLLAIVDDAAVFAAGNSFIVDRIRAQIGPLLVEMFRQRGYEVQEMQAIILGDEPL